MENFKDRYDWEDCETQIFQEPNQMVSYSMGNTSCQRLSLRSQAFLSLGPPKERLATQAIRDFVCGIRYPTLNYLFMRVSFVLF